MSTFFADFLLFPFSGQFPWFSLRTCRSQISNFKFTKQGNCALCDWSNSTKLGHRVGYLDWPSRRICTFPFVVNGNRQSLEPARRSFGFSVSNFHCAVVALCQGGKDYEGFGLVEREVSASNFLHLALAMVMVTFRCFSGHFTDPFLSGVTGVFLHVRCIPHQNSQWLFWASVCVWPIWRDVKLLTCDFSPLGIWCCHAF